MSSWLRDIGKGKHNSTLSNCASEPQLIGNADPQVCQDIQVMDQPPDNIDHEALQGQSLSRPSLHHSRSVPGSLVIRNRLAHFENRLHIRQSKVTTFADREVRQGLGRPFATQAQRTHANVEEDMHTAGHVSGGSLSFRAYKKIKKKPQDRALPQLGNTSPAALSADTLPDEDQYEYIGESPVEEQASATFLTTCSDFGYDEQHAQLTPADLPERGKLHWPYNIPLLTRSEPTSIRLAPRSAGSSHSSTRKKTFTGLPFTSATAGVAKSSEFMLEAPKPQSPVGAAGLQDDRHRLRIVRDLLDGYAADPLQEYNGRYTFDPFGEGGWERVDGGSSGDFLQGFVEKQEQIEHLLQQQQKEHEQSELHDPVGSFGHARVSVDAPRRNSQGNIRASTNLLNKTC